MPRQEWRRDAGVASTTFRLQRGRVETVVGVLVLAYSALDLIFARTWPGAVFDAVLVAILVSTFRARIELSDSGIEARRLLRRRLTLGWTEVAGFYFFEKRLVLRRTDGRLETLALGKSRRASLVIAHALNDEMHRRRGALTDKDRPA